MSALTIIGATGLVGSHFVSLSATAKLPGISKIIALSRRAIPETANVTNVVTSNIVADLPADTKILFSGLGTTKGAVGGFENQYKIDHDLNVEAAAAAKRSGAAVYVIISATGADVNSRFAYSVMKGEIERDVIALGFDRTIIIRPGIILGDRAEKRSLEAAAQGLFKGLIKLPYLGAKIHSSTAASAVDIAKAALKAIQNDGKGVEIVENAKILQLAREYDQSI